MKLQHVSMRTMIDTNNLRLRKKHKGGQENHWEIPDKHSVDTCDKRGCCNDENLPNHFHQNNSPELSPTQCELAHQSGPKGSQQDGASSSNCDISSATIVENTACRNMRNGHNIDCDMNKDLDSAMNTGTSYCDKKEKTYPIIWVRRSECDNQLDCCSGITAHKEDFTEIRLQSSSLAQSNLRLPQENNGSLSGHYCCSSAVTAACHSYHDDFYYGSGQHRYKMMESGIDETTVINSESRTSFSSATATTHVTGGHKLKSQRATTVCDVTVKEPVSSFRTKGNNDGNNKRKNVIIISSAAASSSILFFNFILFSAFLLNSFNYPLFTRADILSSSGNSNFLKNYAENISLVKPAFLQDHHKISGHTSDNSEFGDKNDFNRSIYSSSYGTVGKAEHFTKTTSEGAEPGELLRDLLSKPLDSLDKNVLLKTIWEALTPAEVHAIFGHHPASHSSTFKSVPNFDVTKPELTHHHNTQPNSRNGKRDKRSASSSFSEENANYPENGGDTNDNPYSQQPQEKMIQLEGLGRQFTLSMYPNQKLLDPYFVHLHRHQNRSEILSQEFVKKELPCFYHGRARHQAKEDDTDVELGAVAMSLCGGLKGFILPASATGIVSTDSNNKGGGGHQYHYVIHPLPDRLLKSVPARESADRKENEASNHHDDYRDAHGEGHNRHHIIFRRPGTIYPKLAPQQPPSQQQSSSSLKSTKNGGGDGADKDKQAIDVNKKPVVVEESASEIHDNVEFPICMHHDSSSDAPLINHISSNDKTIRMKYNAKNYNKDDNYKRRSGDIAAHKNNDELDPPSVLSTGEPFKPEHRMQPIISTSADDFESHAEGINDLESLTEENRQHLSPSSPTSTGSKSQTAGHSFRRPKRSTTGITNFDTETIDPFTYKPASTVQDPYWIQYRDRGLRTRSTITSTSNFNNHNNRRLSSQFSYDGISGPSARFTGAPSGPSPSFQPSFWSQQQQPRTTHGSTSPQHNLSSRPARGSRYDEIPAEPGFDEDTGTAGSDHMTWSKGILVFESSGSDEDRHYPGKDVPFYTKNSANKRKPKGISTTSSVVASTSSTSSKSNSNTRSFDWFNGGIADSGSSGSSTRPWNSLDKNRTSKAYSSGNDLGSPASRKGRRDDGVFGDKWKSSLDSEIIWADRSNEINNKQSRFEDLSNVKDRPPSHLTIETAVFVDKDLYKHMQQNFPEDTQGEVTRIVLAMINAVQLLYQDPSLGHRVDFVLKRLEVLEADPPSLIRPYDIDRFLTNFCKWQKTENPASDADPLHWDHALILTGLDLYVVHQSGKISNQVVGLAPVAGMCTRSSSCTVNEGRHFESVFVVAHEIGHNLGMRHDGPQAENNCDPTSHIMSPTLGSGKITWSPCSKKYLDLFLETNQAKCLFDKAKSDRWLDHNGDGRLPGERFDADRQCVLKYGRGSYHATQQPLEDVCRDLHCRREFFTWTSHPALDGTRCSANDDMWCRSGKCVAKITGSGSPSSFGASYEIGLGNSNKPNHDGFSGGSNHLSGSETAAYVTQKALDGGWGKWSPYTDCSSACLYSDDGTLTMGSNGVRLAARRCDSPRPENGGRQCSGPDRRYKTCTAHKICTKTPTRTTVSQYATEVCSRAAQVDTELTGRGYMSSSNDAERACSVWCETNDNSGPRSRGWSFPDGTSCKLMSLPKNAQAFCVAGKCQEFTCNPYSHFRLSEDDCAFTSSNDVIPIKTSDRRWINEGSSSTGVKINHRSGKVGWTDWEIQSDCKLACLAPAKGLQLVKRQCAADDALCTGLSLSVRLCKPDKYTVQANGCSRLQTPFEYATKVCSKYADKVSGLSGIGMQLSPTKDDTDRPCRIGCQDASIAYRFYMVNGEEGWFPAGTDCSRGDQDKKAYCMAGKCIDFGDDDTPLYQINSNVMGSLFQLPQQRTKREAPYHIMEPLQTDPNMDQSSLKKLVHKFSQETGNYPSLVQRAHTRSNPNDRGRSIDFARPVFVASSSTNTAHGHFDGPNAYSYASTNDIFNLNQKDSRENRGRSFDANFVDVKSELEGNPSPSLLAHRSGHTSGGNAVGGLKIQPVEGTFYEWRKIVSDCSVACGTGIQEVIVQCVSGDTVVNDSLCQGRPRPGYSGYISCYKDCARSSSSAGESGKGSHLWNWIQSILPPKNTSYTNNNINSSSRSH